VSAPETGFAHLARRGAAPVVILPGRGRNAARGQNRPGSSGWAAFSPNAALRCLTAE